MCVYFYNISLNFSIDMTGLRNFTNLVQSASANYPNLVHLFFELTAV